MVYVCYVDCPFVKGGEKCEELGGRGGEGLRDRGCGQRFCGSFGRFWHFLGTYEEDEWK